MVNFYLSLMIITATTVGKIMLCSVAGMIVSRQFADPEKTLKGLSYIATMVFLPCLLFTNLCMNVTWEELSKFYWAPLFACLPMGLGFLSSMLVRVFLTQEYHVVIILASTFQNGLTFPASVLLNLKGIEWFNNTAVVDAESYIFLYNVLCSLGLWLIGEPMIAYAKARDVQSREVSREEALLPMEQQDDTVTDLNSEAAASENCKPSYLCAPPAHHEGAGGEDGKVSSPRTAAAEQHRTATAREQLKWYRPSQTQDKPITLPRGCPASALDSEVYIRDAKRVQSAGERLRRLGLAVFKSLQSPPVLSSLTAILVSLTPPLRWLAKSCLGEPIVGGMSVIGHGAIPLQLLVLGSSIAANRPKDDPASPTRVVQAEMSFPPASGTPPRDADGAVMDVSASQSGNHANAFVRWVTSKVPPQIIFTWCTVITRLVIIPSVCFLTLHLLVKIGLMPNDKPFLLAMLVAVMSPSAMNSTLICTMHDYHARDYARMIFCMYLSSSITSTLWLFLFILYLKD
ncbi:hypothetical protein JKF63_05794 [Porcisia hertigi]|uniref:Uncharacterized protein n=1 Tax=Porcisia hertigi TaxID=2761500 RepID=A0A836IRD3_9TRYP|nr:hypothetical protein JKF63_05794 [Porcisia hertigi]